VNLLYTAFYSFWFSEGTVNELGIRSVSSKSNFVWLYFQRNFRGGELVSYYCAILLSYLALSAGVFVPSPTDSPAVRV